MASNKVTPKRAQKRKHFKGDDQDPEEEESMQFSDEEGGYRIDDIYIPPPPKRSCSVENTGPRLIITSIVNNFFKSYARETHLGPFHKCFNAIVGPNGSGKSNVIDSMLFVFGYRATKIRSKKISVLLHNSETYRNVQSCTVSVHFAQIVDKEGDIYDIVPGSKFVISRTANKDNSSYYQIDGRRVQFKEVALLLRAHGIDLDHNRFLILQGEVEQISMMKPKGVSEHETGMLEYLEDIIGTTRYKVPLEKLQEKVDILGEQRLEKVNRLKLVENEVAELKAPMEEAVGFLKLENEIIQCKNVLYQKSIFDLEAKIKKTEESKTELDGGKEELTNKLKSIADDKAAKEATLHAQTEKFDKLQKKRDALKEAFENANKKDIQLQADMTQLNKTRKSTKELLATERDKLEAYEKTPEESKQGIIECEKKISQVSVKKEKLEEDKSKLLASIQNETAELQERKAALQTQLITLNENVDETKSNHALAESELKLYVSKEEVEIKKYDTLKETVENVERTIEEKTKEVAVLGKKIPPTESSLKEATADLQSVKLEESQIINRIRKQQGQLEESRSSMQASKSRGRVLDSLMQQKREGNCPGLFGRLGDLGAIDQKYDVAISTACGPLDNIVVDTVTTAQWCIDFLKKRDIGRATFIALEKQEHLRQQANSKIKTPENVHRLFDLIKIEDERVRPAFYFGLRDTLVANDLDQASRIAYGAQRYRVVTLGGDLIEMTGTMSGGGRTVLRGRMGQSVAVSTSQPVNIEAMEEEINQMENTVRELRQRQNKLESQINVLQPELHQMKSNYSKFKIDLQSLKQQLPNLQQQLREQEKKKNATKADPGQVKRLTTILNQKKELYDAAAANTVELQRQVDAITKEINDKTSGKIKTLDKNLQEIIKTIDRCKTEITKFHVAVKTAERNAKKSKEKIATMEHDIKSSEENLHKMKAQREEIEADGKNFLTIIGEINEKIAGEEHDFSAIKENVGALTKKENKLKADMIEIDQKLKTVKETLNSYKGEIHQWRVKLTHLKQQDIPEQEVTPLRTFTEEEIAERDFEGIQKELQSKEEKFRAAKPNLNAITEYRKKRVVYMERTNELCELTEKKNQMKEQHDQLRQRRKEEFIVGYNIIRMKLKEMYQMITLGGDADFEMVDTFDPFTEGIQFNVRPPKKSWKSICNLSGGEKTLSSLSLVFALHYYKPSPLYVMDEIDAALDFKNVSIVGNYIKERTKNAQFIIISLRSNMFEICDYLIGIYKTFNCTKSFTIDPREKKQNSETEIAAVAENKENSNGANTDVQINGHVNFDSLPGSTENTEMEDSFQTPVADSDNDEMIEDSMDLEDSQDDAMDDQDT